MTLIGYFGIGILVGYITRCIVRYFLNKLKKSDAAKKEIKAEFFRLCEDLVISAGTKPICIFNFEELKKISHKMGYLGMGEIADAEFENIKKLYADLGYREKEEINDE